MSHDESVMTTREQRYANKIYGQVKALKESGTKKEQRQYGSFAHRLPILIRTAGLAQALAFVDAKCRESQQGGGNTPPAPKLLNDIAQVIDCTDGDALLEKSRTSPLYEYMRLSQQVMAALLWYKRFAQSVLNIKQGDEDTSDDESGVADTAQTGETDVQPA
jgi:CRISPR-associated protein Cmr5